MIEGYAIRAVRTGAEREAVARVALEVRPSTHARPRRSTTTSSTTRAGRGSSCGARTSRWPTAAPAHPPLRARLRRLVGRARRARAASRPGLGSALYARLSRAAEAAGKHALHVLVSEASARASPGWSGAASASGSAPAGSSSTSRLPRLRRRPSPRASRSSRSRSAPTCSRRCTPSPVEAFADIPGSDEAHSAGSFDDGSPAPSRLRASSRDGLLRGARRRRGSPAMRASRSPARTRDIAWHDMTAVARAQRGRGIATALKRATIAWAGRPGSSACRPRTTSTTRSCAPSTRASATGRCPTRSSCAGRSAGQPPDSAY